MIASDMQDKCTNMDGYYHCSCPGRPGTRLAEDRHSCEEIDMCEENNGGCSHTCTSSHGQVNFVFVDVNGSLDVVRLVLPFLLSCSWRLQTKILNLFAWLLIVVIKLPVVVKRMFHVPHLFVERVIFQ